MLTWYSTKHIQTPKWLHFGEIDDWEIIKLIFFVWPDIISSWHQMSFSGVSESQLIRDVNLVQYKTHSDPQMVAFW